MASGPVRQEPRDQLTDVGRPAGFDRPAAAPTARRLEGDGLLPVINGTPIDLASLSGRIVYDDFEDIFTVRPDGSDRQVVTDRPGSEFDGAWSPDGRSIVYRDSRRGINEDDEIYVIDADGTGATNLTNDPANDWGPDWSPDGKSIAFNSDRDGMPLRGYLMDPTGANVRPIDADVWFEYPSFSPDGRRIVFESAVGADYDIYTIDLETGTTTRLTDTSGDDSWPAWSPDGSTIAFTRNGMTACGPRRTRIAGVARSGRASRHLDHGRRRQNQRRVSPRSASSLRGHRMAATCSSRATPCS